MFAWYQVSSRVERRTFWACFGGWGLDALDGQMLGLVLPALAGAFALTAGQAGSIASATLAASALGGWLAGALSDRFGRVRILQFAILWFSVLALAGACAQTYAQLVTVKALQGFGFGGEWAAGAVLLAETIRPAHRGRALGTVQGAWAVGWGASVVLYTLTFSFLAPGVAWRAMFALGALPALLVLYIRRSVPEPRRAAGRDFSDRSASAAPGIFSSGYIRATFAGALLGVGAHGGYYALMTWLPAYLKTERHLSILGTGSYLAVIIAAFGCGCLASAQLQDRIGRRLNLGLFAGCCVATLLIYLLVPISNRTMLLLGFPLGFFAAGIPAGMGALFSELFPAGIRGTGVGFCYNFGRIASALFPWWVGRMSQSMRLGRAIGLDAGLAYGLVILSLLLLPETKGKVLV